MVTSISQAAGTNRPYSVKRNRGWRYDTAVGQVTDAECIIFTSDATLKLIVLSSATQMILTYRT